MKYLKFSMPMGFCLLLMTLTQFDLQIWFFPILLVFKQLNTIWGEYTEEELREELQFFYGTKQVQFFKIGCAVFLIGFNVWALVYVYHYAETSIPLLAFFASLVFVNACYAQPLAHDLEHSSNKLSLLAGNGLLFCVCLPFFREDHIQGHHRLVGTKEDHTSAQLNQSFYHFLGRAFRQRVYRSYVRTGFLSPEHRREIQFFTALLLAFAVLLFWIKPMLCFFWLGQALLVYFLHELINYIQHYGLNRPAGTPVGLHHSWNCYCKYANYIIFLLPAHSAHHVGKPLDQMTTIMGPKLPFSFIDSALLALVPKLWFSVMNPLVEAVQKNQVLQKSSLTYRMNNNKKSKVQVALQSK